ncbi:hypothetical protein [Methylobacterium haplocladii]|uniref:Glycine/betaine ABC transporter permease n=1 Tax=Methylobacterium haplocladii TaxID=1176176 RepID=A0A512IS11_9HYPH|nr:hypothetical protein [Methylobacterium haplocladii]GEP00473.1 hypothetical protein MHA02_28600 [Methylobacterium haplocladii]GJD82506.1 hypothetical protein HPGCJGGD_0363 [Methylobacterium haplocladii]GLS59590.1 hypothetical protein GCM10007887_22590 [Methylobacterium haplocladii]
MSRFVDWFFRDRATGAIVIGQWPNLPLWVFGLSAGLAWIVEASAVAVPAWAMPTLQIISAVGLAWWALDEVIRGVNPWRRCLGGGVVLLMLWQLIRRL